MRRRGKSSKGLFFFIVLLLVFSIYGFIILDKNIKPTILAMSEVKARVTQSPLVRWSFVFG